MRLTETGQGPDINIQHIRRVFFNSRTSEQLFETYDVVEATEYAEDNMELTPLVMEAWYNDKLMGIQHFMNKDYLN